MLARWFNILLWTFIGSFVVAAALVAGLSMSSMAIGASLEDDMRGIMTKLDEQ